MANWSLDLPSLTDGYADEFHICTQGETSLKAEIRNQEGLGNKSDMESVLKFKRSGEGVFAVASTTNSLKVLVDFLTSPAVKIPVRALDVGMITPVEIRKACKMSERKRKFFTILAFEAVVTPEASQLAELVGVKVICGHVLEDLCQQFQEHIKEMGEETKDDEAIFPCLLNILPNLVFSKKDPFVLGVFVAKGLIKVGIPICILRSGLDLGRIAWIEKDQRPVEVARLGETVIIKIVASNEEEEGHEIITPTQERGLLSDFDVDDFLISRISRGSIDALKANYRDVLSMSDWKLVCDLKYVFKIK